MPKVNIDIEKAAKLANLTLSEKEKKLFSKQLSEVVDYVNKLQELDTETIEPIGHITGLTNVAREDNPAPSLSQDLVLKNTSKTYNGFFEVDAIFEEKDE